MERMGRRKRIVQENNKKREREKARERAREREKIIKIYIEIERENNYLEKIGLTGECHGQDGEEKEESRE